MTITIDPFWAGVIATLAIEFGAFFLTCIYVSIANSVKSRRNASK